MTAKNRNTIHTLRTWVEIDSRAAAHNYRVFRSLVSHRGFRASLFAVVKSNAYGHGLFAYSLLADALGVDGFCVDSVIEAVALRGVHITKPILVLGPTLRSLLHAAREENVTVSVGDRASLAHVLKEKHPPAFHMEIDTGMHRRGFYPEELPKIITYLASLPPGGQVSSLRGIYTHFAAAKDLSATAYTEMQFKKFTEARERFRAAGFKRLTAHASATGGILLGEKYHLDMVRAGIGLYGLWPSRELELQLGNPGNNASGRPVFDLRPVLSWRSVVSEVKPLKAGDYVGYDCTERIVRPAKMAVVPVGYWHGFPRACSCVGSVLVRGHRARVLGRVSMDMIAIDVTGIAARPGDTVTLIGTDGGETVTASEASNAIGMSYYEFLTRLNPLMERIVV